MSDSVRIHRRQPTRLCRPWDSPGKSAGVGCHFLLQCMEVKVKSLGLLRPWDFPGESTGVGCHCLLHDQPRQHIIKQRHYFVTKGPSSQGYGFSVVMYGCESWTIKKAEHQRIDVFELWFWRRHLRVPWTARRSNQSNLKEISPGCSLEGLMLKLKLQYFGHLMQRADWKRL